MIWCVVCGAELPEGKRKYCSPKCSKKYWNKKRAMLRPKADVQANGYYKCHYCGKRYNHGNDKLFCSGYCKKMYSRQTFTFGGTAEHLDKTLERPYTKDTPMLVYKWRERGDSWELIADLLHRSIDNIRKAYDLYALQIGVSK